MSLRLGSLCLPQCRRQKPRIVRRRVILVFNVNFLLSVNIHIGVGISLSLIPLRFHTSAFGGLCVLYNGRCAVLVVRVQCGLSSLYLPSTASCG